MSVNEIYDLLKKYRENRCTPGEKERIVGWYQQFEEEAESLPEIPQGKLDQLWSSIEDRVNGKKGRRIGWMYRYAAAVVILCLVAGGIIYYNQGTKKNDTVQLAQQEILPAKGVVVLQLSDGRQVPLTEAGTIQDQEGVVIKNDSSKILDYSLAASTGTHPVYNTITVPTGGEYRVLLADGSSVRLNSCSSLTYPVPFEGDVREVELKGEGYFDVVKSAKPFIVKTSCVDVRVLGTSFNVSDYAEDREAQTTLVEGSVVVRGLQQVKECRITPGMMLAYAKRDGQMRTEEVDTDLYVSWMKGKFHFEDMCLEDIMTKLNRWYDCEVEYEDGALRELRFSGAAEKDRPASYLLGMIETVTDVKFEVSGKKILVMHK